MLLRHRWINDQKCDLHTIQTRLTPDQIPAAEYLAQTCAELGLDLRQASAFMMRNYQPPSLAKWVDVIAESN